MRAIDTNVLARWVLRDDPAQALVADAVLAEACYIPLTVLLELGWVLGKHAAAPRDAIALTLESVMEIETATIERPAEVRWAIERFRLGADWGDMLHIAASAQGADALATFDRAIPRRAGVESPLRIEVLQASA